MVVRFCCSQVAQLASQGKVVGLDRSELMLRVASARNTAAIEHGRLELLLGSVDELPVFASLFDKVFAVNVFMFWDDPVAVLRGLHAIMKPRGLIGLTLQPRQRGATNDDTLVMAERMEAALSGAGFSEIHSEMLKLKPVNAATTLGRA